MQRAPSPAEGVASLVSGVKGNEGQNTAHTVTTLLTLSLHCTHNTRHCTHCHKRHCSSVNPREGRGEAMEAARWRGGNGVLRLAGGGISALTTHLRHVVCGSCRDSTATM